MDIDEMLRGLKEIKENPDVLLQVDSELDSVLKEIIKIERKHLYGLDSTSAANRKSAVQELLNDKLKNKER